MTQFDHAFDWARRHVDAERLPTAVLGIASADGIVALDAFGATEGRSVQTDDSFPLFSVTKPIVGLAALHLIEQGRLSLDTPLSDAVPGFGANRPDEVLLRHLVSHTSGIVHTPLDAPSSVRDELLRVDRDFSVGTAARYSSLSYAGIAALIEHASGRSWEHEIDAVGARAGANGFTFDGGSSPHLPVDASDAELDFERMVERRHPGAGLFARASDLLAVGSALLRNDGSLLAPVTRDAMLRPLTTGLPKLSDQPDRAGHEFGVTWTLRTGAPSLLAPDTFGHSGWSGTEFWVTPSLGVCFVLLTNRLERPGVDADLLHNAVAAGA